MIGVRPRGWLVSVAAAIAIGSPAVTADRAAAGGTAVVAPKELDAAACRQGVHPRILGFRQDVAPSVLGCVVLSDGDKLLVAADSNGRLACFYAALAGGQHVDGPCTGVGPQPPPEPVAGVNALDVSKPQGGSGAYVGGLLPAGAPHTFVRYRTEDGDTAEWPAQSIRVGPRLARRLGATRPFAYFVGEIPKGADTCRRLRIEVRGRDAELIDAEALNAGTVFADGLPLPGSKDCEAGRASARGAASLGVALGAASA